MGRKRRNYGCVLVCVFLVGAYAAAFRLALVTAQSGTAASTQAVAAADAGEALVPAVGASGDSSVAALSLFYFAAIVAVGGVCAIALASLPKWLRGYR